MFENTKIDIENLSPEAQYHLRVLRAMPNMTYVQIFVTLFYLGVALVTKSVPIICIMSALYIPLTGTYFYLKKTEKEYLNYLHEIEAGKE